MIKVYFAKTTQYSQADYSEMYSLLECAIRQKIDVKKRALSKQQSIVGYSLLYRGFEELYQKKNVKIEFNQHGKPNCDFCYFSISHSEEYVVCVLSDRPIGVDVQKISHIKQRDNYKFFTDKESCYVNQNPAHLSQKYLEIFTKKEAASKMLGLSLTQSSQIDTFSNAYNFKTDISDGFVITICTQNVSIM